jgi:undecaprenyl diphosphate synthase
MNGLIIPNHIAIVLDGNRRWASEHRLKPWEGHKYGADTFNNFVDWCIEVGVPQVSAYVLSTENLRRSPREVIELLRLFKKQLDLWENEKASLFDKYEVKVKFCGDFRKLPSDLVNVMKRLMERTEKYHKRIFNVLVAYGGRFELTEMIKKLVNSAIRSGRIQVTERAIEENLLISGDVDLVIRTGGENRLSNLLPWQSAYAELYVTETLWPDFTKEEFLKAIEWFSEKKRNFGK